MRTMWRWIRIVLALVGLLAAAGAAYQAIGAFAEARCFPEAGRPVDIGGRRLQLHCTGSGSPAVILEAGYGDLLDEWRQVQPRLAQLTRVCSYDRAGYGGSDPGPMPRTSTAIAADLHALLESAGERPPYVLVGHSLGGYNVRVFNGRYPREVAGIVLVDSTQEDQYVLLPAAWRELEVETRERMQRLARWAPAYIGFGIARLTLRRQGARGPLRILQTKYLRARASELESIRVSAEQARGAGQIDTTPLVVLTGGRIGDAIVDRHLTARDLEAYRRIWVDDLQLRLAHLSSRSTRVLLPESGHDIPNERPDAVIAAVRSLLHR